MVGVLGCLAEVVQDGQAGKTSIAHFAPDESVDGDGVSDVQVSGGLVENENIGLLGEGPGNGDPHLLAPGQLPHPLAGQVDQIGTLEDLVDDPVVLGRGSEHGALMGGSAHHDDLADAEVEGDDGLLGDDGDPPGNLSSADAGQILAEKAHGAVGRGEQPRKHLDQR